jgi:pimeloyl-ACP methyl ester carboxylesterase
MIAARLTSALHDVAQSPILEVGAQALDRVLSRRQVDLPSAIRADRHEIATSDAGTISYYADTRAGGRPVVLLHGIHAAASSYDMRPLFDALREHRSVYALDLPGFGFSERSSRPYTPATYVHAIEHLLRNVAISGSRAEDPRASTRVPADVIALSLSGEYAAKVAVEMPELVRSLVLISPTGFAGEAKAGWLERFSRRKKPALPSALSESVPSRLFYELLVSKPSLRWFLRRSFEARVDGGLYDYAYSTSHQPGAWRAPIAFVAGRLFPTGSARNIYAHVRAPTLVLYDQDAYTSFEALPAFEQEHTNFRSQRVPHTRGLPQFDAPEQTLEALQAFYRSFDERTPAPLIALHGGRVIGSA